MHAPNQSEFQSVCVSFLSGFGVGDEEASAVVAAFDVTSFEPDILRPRLLDLAAAAGAEEHECRYVSTPITTGRHHLRAGDSARFKIISGNRERATVVVERLRQPREERVIDPTQLVDVPGWDQVHYHKLWTDVIDRFARTVVFVDDWQYSVGCTMEFRAAYLLALPIFTQDLRPLAYDQARHLLTAAAREVRDVVGPDAPLLHAVAEVEDLAQPRPGGS